MKRRQFNLTGPPKTLDELAGLIDVKPPVRDERALSPQKVNSYALRLIAEYAKRLKDAMSLYRPLPNAEAFYSSSARTRLVVGSNQAGKTLCACVEFARIARGKDPYRKRKPENLRLLSVSKDAKHIGQVIWKKLAWPGAFEIVPDEKTGMWRSVRPDPNNPTELDPIDLERKKLWMPSPPLIPPNEISQCSWENKKLGVVDFVRLVNGTEMLFHASGGYPRQGIEVDVGWFDEEIENNQWLPETRARLLKRDGIFFWSFTPQASTPQAFEIHVKGESGEPDIDEFTLLLDENPYVTKRAKQALYDALKDDPDELAVRYFGRYAILGRRVYPTYDISKHGIEGFVPPNDWMRLIFVDPGTTAAAALFIAIPPAANEVHFYDELIVKNGDASQFAEEVKRRTTNYKWEAFIIDPKGGKQTPMGFGKTVADHYAEEFEKRNIVSRLTGSYFDYGSADVSGRELSLKRWLRFNDSRDTLIKVHRDKLRHFDQQMKNRYYKKTDLNKREDKTAHDIVDAAEYAAAWFDEYIGVTSFGLYYSEPESAPQTTKELSAYRAFKKFFGKTKPQSVSIG